jgi:hypothetical protein
MYGPIKNLCAITENYMKMVLGGNAKFQRNIAPPSSGLNSTSYRKSEEADNKLSLPCLLFNNEDGCNMFLSNIRLLLNYTGLQPRRLYSSQSQENLKSARKLDIHIHN